MRDFSLILAQLCYFINCFDWYSTTYVFFVCRSGYYRLCGSCILLKGIGLYLRRWYISRAALFGSLHNRRKTLPPRAFTPSVVMAFCVVCVLIEYTIMMQTHTEIILRLSSSALSASPASPSGTFPPFQHALAWEIFFSPEASGISWYQYQFCFLQEGRSLGSYRRYRANRCPISSSLRVVSVGSPSGVKLGVGEERRLPVRDCISASVSACP